ncbi:ABC transporter permease subunit [Paenibacillus sp. HB172176]|uniref:ABC transporter permease subunit n=1 Tax=Paenibacillus sp. HB172176 TaxID=2493690 RepID=UPI001F0E9D8E|nr:ABC transporter permease subunit [Paenibacillus sp. HB172176]
MKNEERTMNRKPFSGIQKRRLYLSLCAIPFVVFYLTFSYAPLAGWLLAFLNFKPGIPLDKTPFVGLGNFDIIRQDWSNTIRVIRNTLAMNAFLIICAPLPAVFAIFLNEMRSKRYKKFVQTVTTLPNFISWVIIFSISYVFFSSEGLLNALLALLGMENSSSNIMGNGDAVWYFQTALGVWKTLGWNAIIYLAAISGVDNELYDAVYVDGGGRFRKIWHVTVPGIMPTFVVLLILQLSSILTTGIDQYLVFRNPLVADAIETIDLYVYRLGIQNNDISYATAVGMIQTLISIMLLFAVNRFSKKINGQSII